MERRELVSTDVQAVTEVAEFGIQVRIRNPLKMSQDTSNVLFEKSTREETERARRKGRSKRRKNQPSPQKKVKTPKASFSRRDSEIKQADLPAKFGPRRQSTTALKLGPEKKITSPQITPKTPRGIPQQHDPLFKLESQDVSLKPTDSKPIPAQLSNRRFNLITDEERVQEQQSIEERRTKEEQGEIQPKDPTFNETRQSEEVRKQDQERHTRSQRSNGPDEAGEEHDRFIYSTPEPGQNDDEQKDEVNEKHSSPEKTVNKVRDASKLEINTGDQSKLDTSKGPTNSEKRDVNNETGRLSTKSEKRYVNETRSENPDTEEQGEQDSETEIETVNEESEMPENSNTEYYDSEDGSLGDDEYDSPRDKHLKRILDVDARYSFQKPESPHFEERKKHFFGTEAEEEGKDMSIRVIYKPKSKRRSRRRKSTVSQQSSRAKSSMSTEEEKQNRNKKTIANFTDTFLHPEFPDNAEAETTIDQTDEVNYVEVEERKVEQMEDAENDEDKENITPRSPSKRPSTSNAKSIAFEIDFDKMADYMNRVKDVYSRKEQVMLQAIENMKFRVEDMQKYYSESDKQSVAVRTKQAQAIMKLSYDNLLLTKKIERLSQHQRDLVRGRWKVGIDGDSMKFVQRDSEDDQIFAAHNTQKEAIPQGSPVNKQQQQPPQISKKQQLVNNILFDDFSTNYALKTSLTGKIQDSHWKNFNTYAGTKAPLVAKRKTNQSIGGSLSARKPNAEDLKLPLIGNQMQLL
jgi:hypothetical protein